jgi:alcohol dehydrogenase class IV
MTVDDIARLAGPFHLRDGARLICFGRGVVGEAPDLLETQGMVPFVLLTGSRGVPPPAALSAAARAVIRVPPGPVPETASITEALVPGAGDGLTIVALGGGRVIDTAKAVASAQGLEVAAIPTTLSGAEMTAGHRPLADGRGSGPKRPRLVVNDPALSSSQPATDLAASAMNALGHAMEAFYGPGADRVTTAAATKAVKLIAGHLEAAMDPAGEEDREQLALGSLLAGYALGGTGLGVHHVLCQTIVRLTSVAHARVNAVMLPHTYGFMLTRRRDALAPLASVLSRQDEDAGGAELIARLAALSGATRLEQLGISDGELPAVAAAAQRRPELRRMSPSPTTSELLAVLEAALR